MLTRTVLVKTLVFIAVCIFIYSCIPSQVNGQTQIDLRSQSRNVDFSQALSVRPFRTGTTLPATCNAGEMFFKTNALAGANVYGCGSANIWSVQSGTDADGASVESDFLADLNVAAGTLTIVCPTGKCNTRTGDAITSFSTVQATYVPSTGSYTAFIYVEGSTLKYGYSSGTMATCNPVCTADITDFPANVVPLYTVGVSGGAFQATSLIDMRSRFQAVKKLTAGPNVTITETAGTLQIDSAASGGGGGSVEIPLSAPVLGSDGLGNVIPASASAYAPGIPGQTENLIPAGSDFLNVYDGTDYRKVRLSNLPGGYYGANRSWWVSTGDFAGLSSIQMANAPNLIRVYMVYLRTKVQFSKISLLRTAALAGTVTGAAGIYDATKTLSAQTGVVLLSNSPSANVAISASLGTSVVLEPGQYYVAFSADTTTAAVGGISLYGGLSTLLSTVTPGVMFTSNVAYSNLTGLPANLGTLTRDNGGFGLPAIVLHQ